MTNFGQRLRAARLAAKLSQAQLAEQAGMTQGQISKLERGERLKSTNTHALAAAVRVPAEELLGTKRKTVAVKRPTPYVDQLTLDAISLFERLGVSDRTLALALLRVVHAQSHQRENRKPAAFTSRQRSNLRLDHVETGDMTEDKATDGHRDGTLEKAGD